MAPTRPRRPIPRPRDAAAADACRRFLNACGRFAAATPPAVTLLLAGHHGRPPPPERASEPADAIGAEARRPVP